MRQVEASASGSVSVVEFTTALAVENEEEFAKYVTMKGLTMTSRSGEGILSVSYPMPLSEMMASPPETTDSPFLPWLRCSKALCLVLLFFVFFPMLPSPALGGLAFHPNHLDEAVSRPALVGRDIVGAL